MLLPSAKNGGIQGQTARRIRISIVAETTARRQTLSILSQIGTNITASGNPAIGDTVVPSTIFASGWALLPSQYWKGGKYMTSASDDVRQRHWSRTRALTFVVLAIWFLFAFIIPWNAQALNAYSFIGFPLGYYFPVQGSLIVFVALIFLQNWRQDKIDDDAGLSEDQQ